MKDARKGIEKTADMRKKAKHGGERKHGGEIGFRPSPLIEGGRKPLTPSTPELTIAHGS
jgi:hypothetical protein